MRKIFLYITLMTGFLCAAQEECSLGIGGSHDETIAEVFQLNDSQLEKMKNWSAELQYRNGLLKDRAKFLLRKNATSAPEQLMSMSFEYRALLDSMKQNVKMLDKRLLSIFNDKQYNLYVRLCDQMLLQPMYADRSVDEK